MSLFVLRLSTSNLYTYIDIYTNNDLYIIYIDIYMYVYIYIEREIERDR